MTAPIDYRCPKCGSRNVVCDADASWNADTQTWELNCTYDAMHCVECDRDASHDGDWTVELGSAA
jgi:hypothetical protein